MNTRNHTNLPSLGTTLKASCLTAFLSSFVFAQDCQTVEFTSSHRKSEVQVGSTLQQSDCLLLGTWSDYLSRSRMHPFDPLQRSVARMSHYSEIDPDRSVVLLSGRAESRFHPSRGTSELSLQFKVDSIWERDLTDGYGYGTGQSALEMACGSGDFWYGSSTHMMMWIEQETRASEGELVDDPHDYPNLVDLWQIEDGVGDEDSEELFLEEVHPGSADYWTDVTHRRQLRSGLYDLQMACNVLADSPSYLSGLNAGTSDLTVLLEFEDRGLGSGDSNQKGLDRRCAAKIRNNKDEDSSTSDQDGLLQANKNASGVTLESSENVLVEETSFWGRHTAVARKGSGPVGGRMEAIAETVVEMTFHDDVSVEFTMTGFFIRDGRGASGRTTLEIRDSSGSIVWSQQVKAPPAAARHPYQLLSKSVAITTPGDYTIHITTKAQIVPLGLAQEADLDCSFAVLIDELP